MEYKFDFRSTAAFELKSYFGRLFWGRKPILKKGKNYLNLGCGANIIDGYVNADFFYRIKFWKKDVLKLQWQLDLRYPLNCNNDVFDGIYSEHTLEHLYPSDAKNLLTELYRVMKKGALIRITVPDLEKYIKYYVNNSDGIDVAKFNNKYETKCSAIRNMTQNFLHLSTWDFEELKESLDEVGFRDIKKKTFNQSDDEMLKLDIEERSWETLYVEACK